MTPFSIMMKFCGLSHADAAHFLGVSVYAVNSYSCDRVIVPEEHMDKLFELMNKIDRVSQFIINNCNDDIDLKNIINNGNRYGFPYQGTLKMFIGHVILKAYNGNISITNI